jgi:hypothetical protein
LQSPEIVHPGGEKDRAAAQRFFDEVVSMLTRLPLLEPPIDFLRGTEARICSGFLSTLV